MGKAKIELGLEAKVSALTRMRARTLADTIGISYLVFSRDEVVASMPVDERTMQPFGLLHGGASMTLAESLASVGAWLNVDETKYSVVGVEINGNHLKAMRSGTVIGRAKPLHRGKRTQLWEIRIENEAGELVCISRCTIAVLGK